MFRAWLGAWQSEGLTGEALFATLALTTHDDIGQTK